MRVLVVLPTYNEADNIENVLQRVLGALPEARVLVVDDNSPDGTAQIADKVGEQIGRVEVLRRPGKAGLGSAYRDGFRWGLREGYEVMVEMDSDLSHDPDDLPRLVAPLEGGVDLVIGSRYVPGGSIPDWSMFRRLISRGGCLYAELLLGLGVKDSTAGFRAYSSRLLSQIDLDTVRADSYGFQIEMTYRSRQRGARIEEIPIRFVDRALGTSKMSTYTVAEALVLVTWWGLLRLLAPVRRALPPLGEQVTSRRRRPGRG